MDYSKIEILDEQRGTLYSFEAISKLERLLFSLSLYPDWRMATKFAGIGNKGSFLPYWIGGEQYNLLLENINERRKVIEESEEDLFTILGNVFMKYQAGGNYLSPFLTDDDVLRDEFTTKVTELVSEPVMAAMGLGKELSPIDVLQQLDTLIAIEKTRRNVVFDTGKYWIISYSEVAIQSRARPFILLARVQESNDNSILYIQGAWPLIYMKNALDRIVPMPYEATLGDMRYVRIHVESSEGGLYKTKYKIEQC